MEPGHRALELLAIVSMAMVLQQARCHQPEPNSYIGPPQENNPVLTIPVIIVPSSKKNLFTSSNSKSELQESTNNYSPSAPPQFYSRPPRQPQSTETYDKRLVPNNAGRHPQVYKIPGVPLGRQNYNQPARGYNFNAPAGPFAFQKHFGQPGGYGQNFPVASNAPSASAVATGNEAIVRPQYNPAPFPATGYNAAPQAYSKPPVQPSGPALNFNYVNIPQSSFSYNSPQPYTKQAQQGPPVAPNAAYGRPSTSGSHGLSASQTSSGYTNLQPYGASPPATVVKPTNYVQQPSSNYRRHPMTYTVSTPATYVSSAPLPPPQPSNFYTLQSPALGPSSSNGRPSSSSYVVQSSSTSTSSYRPNAPSLANPSLVTSGKIHFGSSASVASGYVFPGTTYSKSFGPSNNAIDSGVLKENILPPQASNYGNGGGDYSEDDEDEDEYDEEEDESRESVSYKVVYIPLELLRNILSNNVGLK